MSEGLLSVEGVRICYGAREVLSPTSFEVARGENRRADPAVAPMLVNFIVGGLRAALPRPKTARTPRTRTTPRRQKT